MKLIQVTAETIQFLLLEFVHVKLFLLLVSGGEE